MSYGEHAAPQKALQLKRRKLELHVAGQARWPARALRMEEHGSADEMAGEHGLAELLGGDARAPAEVKIKE